MRLNTGDPPETAGTCVLRTRPNMSYLAIDCFKLLGNIEWPPDGDLDSDVLTLASLKGIISGHIYTYPAVTRALS
jgi:hypothetical protein